VRNIPGAIWHGSLAAIRVGLLLGIAAALVLFAVLLLFRTVDPPGSTLMLMQRVGGQTIDQRWVPLDKVSVHVVRAVIASEDGRFCSHRGIDLAELQEALEKAEERGEDVRGASTITMQVAKNLLLWPSRSYVRKALEIPAALAIEQVWSKPRILEIYLNIAEWGPGIFGIEAAARHHFKKAASRLTAQEAALLAVSLPNPIDRNAGRPGPGTRRLAATIEARMRDYPRLTRCIEGERKG
jgi:monofunctional biosynthetic peptidoglycan transglycosylase